MHNVSQVLIRHISDAERLISRPTEAALLFHEHNFLRHEWTVQSAMGYQPTTPLFYFNFQAVPYKEKNAQLQDVFRFMRSIIDRMQLATECIVISLIYIEKIM